MIDKFNGIVYLVIFIIHFAAYAFYAYRCVFGTKAFLDQYAMDITGAMMVRMFGSFFIASILMAVYIMFIRADGLNGTWGFFTLVFMQNLSGFIVGIYALKVNKLGHTDKTSDEGIYAPGVLMILSAVLCYGLADKIYS